MLYTRPFRRLIPHGYLARRKSILSNNYEDKCHASRWSCGQFHIILGQRDGFFSNPVRKAQHQCCFAISSVCIPHWIIPNLACNPSRSSRDGAIIDLELTRCDIKYCPDRFCPVVRSYVGSSAAVGEELEAPSTRSSKPQWCERSASRGHELGGCGIGPADFVAFIRSSRNKTCWIRCCSS